MKELDIDIALTQEPYHGKTDFDGYKSYRPDKGKTEIIYRQGKEQILERTDITTRNATSITIGQGRQSITIINIYDEPGGSVNRRLLELAEKIDKLEGRLIIAGDLNAKNTAWGGKNTDTRGEHLLEWIETMGLRLENELYDKPTFDNDRGQSWVDLTLTRQIDIRDRKILDQESLSDHRYITYTMDTEQKKTRQKKKRFLWSKTNWKKFEDELTKRETPYNLDPEEWAIDFEKFCKEACHKTIPIKTAKNRTVGNLWRTEELGIQKRELNNARRNMQANRGEEREHLRTIYKKKRSEFRKTIKETKRRHFETFITDFGKDDPWGLPIRILSKERQEKSTTTILKKDGTYTTTAKETEE